MSVEPGGTCARTWARSSAGVSWRVWACWATRPVRPAVSRARTAAAIAVCVWTALRPDSTSLVNAALWHPYRLIAARAAAAAVPRSLDGSAEPAVVALPVGLEVTVDVPAVLAGCGEPAAFGWS